MALSKITNASVSDNAVHGRRNLLINSGFKVAQRGTSFTSSSVNEYSLDRWRTEGYGLSTVISQQSFTAGQTDVPDFPTNYVRVTTNTAIPSGQFWSFQQRIEKPQVIPIGTQNFTLSFWVKSVSGTISASTFSFGISGNKVNCPEITTSWQKITTTINRAVSSSTAYESMYLVHLQAGASAISVDIANVQLEIGSESSPFEHRSFSEELNSCKRYYEHSYPYGTSAGSANNGIGAYHIHAGRSRGNNYGLVTQRYTVEKRAAATVTMFGYNGTSGQVSNGDTGANLGASTVIQNGTTSFLPKNASGGTMGDVALLYHYSADAEL